MELASETTLTRGAPRGDGELLRALATWAIGGALVFALALQGGGYDISVRSHVAIVVWWVVILGAISGLLPAARLTGPAQVALALFAGFVGWTALASTWSLSSERSLDELARVAFYLGVLVLATLVHRDRARAVRHTVEGMAVAIVAVAVIALLSRLHPSMFPAAQTTATLVAGGRGRLAWPLNYWNALAALMALGLPLLLAVATSSRWLGTRAVAAGAIPLVALCGYLTLSRGGLIAGAVALLVFIALVPERIDKLATMLVGAAGSAVLIAGAVHRHAVENGLTGHAATQQGTSLLVATVIVCVAVAIAQTGIGLAARHGTPPRWLAPGPRATRSLLAGGLVILIVIALAAHVPSRLSHAWHDFKQPTAAGLTQNGIGRFGVASGNGRYGYWKVAIDSTKGHLLTGSGPGTFQLVWLPRATRYDYVRNAHSLYVETFAETGLIGLVLLVGAIATVLVTAVRRTRRGPLELRIGLAGCAAAIAAFAVSAASDWIWQVPALPVAMLVLAGAVLAPSPDRPEAPRGRGWGLPIRLALIGAGVASLLAIGVTLASAQAVSQSQAQARAGNLGAALTSARAALRVEPASQSAQLQEALVLELAGHVPAAIASARQATVDEPDNWQPWLVLSRLEARNGNGLTALAEFRRARALNPRSPIFHT